jgi:hypothetical protein
MFVWVFRNRSSANLTIADGYGGLVTDLWLRICGNGSGVMALELQNGNFQTGDFSRMPGRFSKVRLPYSLRSRDYKQRGTWD